MRSERVRLSNRNGATAQEGKTLICHDSNRRSVFLYTLRNIAFKRIWDVCKWYDVSAQSFHFPVLSGISFITRTEHTA